MQITSNSHVGSSSLSRVEQSLERIATGKKINSASDDPAGIAIATHFSSASRQDSISIRNASDGISYTQTADAVLGGQTESIQRLRELALQASNPSLNDRDRNSLQSEFSQLQDEVKRVNEQTNFNGNQILNSDSTAEFQIGSKAGDTISVQSVNLNQQLEDGGFFELDLSSQTSAQNALGSLDSSLENISQIRSDYGAATNRFESVISSQEQSRINNEEARSRIEDADLAKEISDFTRAKFQQQAENAVQVQANASRSSVLQLLQGL